MIELLFLLLPVAAASGWWLARLAHLRRPPHGRPVQPAFLQGLNYLLDEQPDKAIDLFLAQMDGETVETHLALGALFRRRGEVERAIRIHQSLVALKTLSTEQRTQALFELGEDYLRAGLLDRAEVLFQELVQLNAHCERALLGLRDIYQQERDWRQCLRVAQQLMALTGDSMAAEIAQYHCELADEARTQGDGPGVRHHLRAALEADTDCVRAAMLEGRLALADDQPQRALDLFMQVIERRASYLPEILPALTEAMQRLGRGDDLLDFLDGVARHHPTPPLMLSLSDEVARKHGSAAAMNLLTDYLAEHADLWTLERLLELQTQTRDATAPEVRRWRIAREVTRCILARQPVYQCEHCGFQARSLYWQCPSCRSWGSVHPVQPERIPGPEVLHEPRLA